MRIFGPKAVIRSHVEYKITTFGGAGEGSRIAQIACDAFYVEFPDLAGRPAKCSNPIAALHQRARHMPAEEPARSSN